MTSNPAAPSYSPRSNYSNGRATSTMRPTTKPANAQKAIFARLYRDSTDRQPTTIAATFADSFASLVHATRTSRNAKKPKAAMVGLPVFNPATVLITPKGQET